MNFENKLELGLGAYSISEVAQILQLPYYKVSRWVKTYWDGELGFEYENHYSWQSDSSRLVSFHTLVEFYVMMVFSEAGVKTRAILNAHKELSRLYNNPFPFAHRSVSSNMRTDGRKLFLETPEGIITLDGTNQFNLKLLKVFFKNLEFDGDDLASRYWPLGKEKNIVVDPEHKMGHPVIKGTNIFPQVIYNHYVAKESIEYISFLYEISKQSVLDSIEYCKEAA